MSAHLVYFLATLAGGALMGMVATIIGFAKWVGIRP